MSEESPKIYLILFALVAALESILSDIVGDFVEGTKFAVAALEMAAEATRIHSRTLKLAMEVEAEVGIGGILSMSCLYPHSLGSL